MPPNRPACFRTSQHALSWHLPSWVLTIPDSMSPLRKIEKGCLFSHQLGGWDKRIAVNSRPVWITSGWFELQCKIRHPHICPAQGEIAKQVKTCYKHEFGEKEEPSLKCCPVRILTINTHQAHNRNNKIPVTVSVVVHAGYSTTQMTKGRWLPFKTSLYSEFWVTLGYRVNALR